MAYQVRAVTENDWEVLRDVRLQALADSPGAFETTLEMARRFDDDRWRARARGSPTARDFLVSTDATAVGMAGLVIEADEVAEVISVWVHPDHRGRGAGRALVGAAMSFGRGIGATSLRLWVAEGNTVASRFYERLGFTLTGVRQPVPTRPWQDELLMAVHLP